MESKPIYLKMGLNPETVNVDVENRQLNGVIAIEPIDIKDWRPFSINDVFINDLVAMASKEKSGVRSHFGHNWSNEGLLLGKAKNWRVEDGKAKYDLSIYTSADLSPKAPGMGNYLLSQLAEDATTFMTSIVFREKYFYQLDSAGKEIKVYYYDSKGSWVSQNEALGKVYPKLGALYSSDIVSEGAATNSMFGTEKEDMGLFQRILNFFTGHQEDGNNNYSQKEEQQMDPSNTPAATPETPAVDPMVALQEENERLKTALAAATPAPAPVVDPVVALQEENARLKAQPAKTPAAEPVVLNTGANVSAPTEPNLWELDPMNKAAQQYFSNQNKAN